jgi:hypothetical protein
MKYLLEPVYETEGIRYLGLKDIAAMKLSAIADDGTRLKDFIDVACLSTKLSLDEMLAAYADKYPNANPMRPVKCLGFFEDINFKEPIQMLVGSYKWALIEKRLSDMKERQKHRFRSFPVEMKKMDIGFSL